ncbi:MAG: hypothetical protein ABSC94_24915 [Polyangiaceae bacterium]
MTANGPSTPLDPRRALTANAPYDVWLRVHNEAGCSAVTGPINVFIDGADPNLGFENWIPVTPGAGTGAYNPFGTAGQVIVPAFGTAIIGPWEFTPSDGGHKCLLAAIAADGEAEPPTTIQPGQPALPPAYGSNQIAQRNLQIGETCTFNISNTTTSAADLLLGINVTPTTPTPGSSTGPVISLTFSDPMERHEAPRPSITRGAGPRGPLSATGRGAAASLPRLQAPLSGHLRSSTIDGRPARLEGNNHSMPSITAALVVR